jgi:Flp pilus assembly protein TadG
MERARCIRLVTAPAVGVLSPVRRLVRCERGTAVVEFAIVALPLLLIVFGVLDFGRALNYYNDLTQIAGQGARAAAVNQNPNGGAATSAFQRQLACYSTTGELRGGINVAISQMPNAASPTGTPVSVTASYTFHFVPLIRSAGLTLSSTQTVRYESGTTPTYDSTNNVTGGAGSCP